MFNLKEQRAAALKAARTIAESAQAEGRDFTTSELAEVKGHLATAESLAEKIKAAAPSDELMERLKGLGGGSSMDADPVTVTEQKAALARAIATKSPLQVGIPRKALGTAGLNLPGEGNAVFGAPGNGPAAVSLRDLFPVVETESPVIRYYTLGELSGGPDIVEEGGLKPEIVSTVTPHDASMVKLAGRVVHTTEFDEDASTVATEFMRQALMQLVRRENQLVLDQMDAASGVLTASGDVAKPLDAIATAIGEQEALNGFTPERIVLHPADLAAMRLSKSTGSGEYVLDPLATGPATVFGVPVMVTPAIGKGKL